MKMKVVCAWCTVILEDGSDEKVSHGMCPDCFENWMAEIDKQKE